MTNASSHTRAAATGIALVAITGIVACSSGRVPVDRPELAILSAQTHDGLRVLSVESLGPLCPTGIGACMLDRGGQAAANADGNVVFSGFAQGKQLSFVAGHPPTLRNIGGIGGGPGEYRSVFSMGFARSGEILAFDVLQHRVIRYARDGHAVATSSVAVPSGFITAAFVGDELRAIATESRRVGDPVPIAVFALDTGARSPRRLHSLPVRARSYGLSDMRPVPSPFSPQMQWALRRSWLRETA